jgi:hypothetical protein
MSTETIKIGQCWYDFEDLKDMKTDLESKNEQLVNKIEFIENDVLNKK